MKPSHLLSIVSQVCLPRRKPDAQLFFLNLPFKKMYFMFMDVLYVSICTTCRPGAAHRDQKRKSESQKQELRIASRHHLGAGNSSFRRVESALNCRANVSVPMINIRGGGEIKQKTEFAVTDLPLLKE